MKGVANMRFGKSFLSCFLIFCMLISDIGGGRVIVAEDLASDSQTVAQTLENEEVTVEEVAAGEEETLPVDEEVAPEVPAEEVKEEAPEEVPEVTPEETPAEVPAEEVPAEEVAPEEEVTEQPAEEVTPAEEVNEPAPAEEVPEEVTEEQPAPVEEAPASYVADLDEVTVTAEVPAGTFAEDVRFVVTPLVEGTPEYEAAKEAVEAEGTAFDGMLAFDIYFEGLTSGEKIQPDGNKVTIGMKLKDTSLEVLKAEEVDVAVESLALTHIGEEKVEVVADMLNEAPGELQVAVDAGQVNALEATFDVEGFSTFVISWRYDWDNYQYNVHYVDTNGNELANPTINPEFSNNPRYLIYDIEGYEYDSTHLGSAGGSSIYPYIENYGSDRIYYDANGNGYRLRNDIYVVYKAKAAPTQGGTVQPSQQETWPEGKNAPQFSKSSVNNGDGTNTISLSITAAEKIMENSSKANVIVVFDVSGSMKENLGRQTRLQTAKTAVNGLAQKLLAKKDSQGNNLVKMALVSFSDTATVVQGLTTNYTTFSGKVNGLSANGGTNWEKALYEANHIAVDSDAATFVIFVTDGDPTFRMSRGKVSDRDLDIDGNYYLRNNIFGTGGSDTSGRNFDFAVEQVKAIVGANKNFYAIGVSSDVQKVQNLTTQGGVDKSHAFLATDNTALDNAFNTIAENITSALGFGDVEITDGITSLANTEMKVLHEVDPNSFQYYRYGGEGNKYGQDEAHKTAWTTREADGCAAATWNKSKGAVEWNMGETFQLEDGVTYVVTFRVWPSQAAYDLVAELNNGKSYESLTPEEKDQVVALGTTPETYALKTNTNEVKATYNKTTKTGDTVTVSDTHDLVATYHEGEIDNMGLDSMLLTIEKTFNDTLSYSDRDEVVTLVLKRRKAGSDTWEDYNLPGSNPASPNIVLNKNNNWKYSLYVAPGLKAGDEVLEKGYEFTVTEPDIDYHYELNEEIINPMIVDGSPKYLGDGDGNQSLTAENIVKAGIDIKKILTDKDGKIIEGNQEFTFKGYIKDAKGNPYTWKDGDDINASGAYHKFTPNPAGTFTFEDFGYGTKYDRTIYKGHFASTAEIEFTLKPGEFVRFVNVPQGGTFEFYEVTPDAPYEYVSIAAQNKYKKTRDSKFEIYSEQPTISGNKASGTVYGNVQHTVEVTNKVETMEVSAKKVWVNADGTDTAPEGAKIKFILFDGDKSVKSIELDGTPDQAGETEKWTATWKDLPKSENYRVEEELGYPGYKQTSEVKDGVTVITNTQDKTSITITKVWDDNSDQDGYRPTADAFKAYIGLFVGETEVTTAEPTVTGKENDTNAFTITYDNLPKFAADGSEIQYTVKEKSVPEHYELDGSNTAANGETITNKHTPDTTEISVTKEWDDNNNQDGFRPTADEYKTYLTISSNPEVTITAEATVTVDPANANKYIITYTGLQKKANKQDIVYTVTEDLDALNTAITEKGAENGYTSTTTSATDGGTIKNSFTAETTDISVTKEWEDSSNQDGYRPTADAFKADVVLLSNGAEVTTATPTITDKGDDTFTITYSNLPKRANGNVIDYSVKEKSVPEHYELDGSDTAANGGTIKNKHTPETVYVIVTKVWDDNNNQDGLRQDVVLSIFAGETDLRDNKTIAKDATGEALTVSWTNLPKKANGTNIEYSVQEAPIDGYTPTITPTKDDDGNYTIEVKNSHTPATTSISVSKAWVNANGSSDAPANGSVVFTLVKGGTETDQTVKLDGTKDTTVPENGGYESEAWTATFVNLPEKENGATINYTVKETKGYTGYTIDGSDTAENGGTITNKQNVVTVEAYKKWVRYEDPTPFSEVTTAPKGAYVTLTLMDGNNATPYQVKLDGTADTTVPESGGYESEAWKATFVNVPEYDGTRKITYTIREETKGDDIWPGLVGYNQTYSRDKLTVYNKQKTVTVDADKQWVNYDGTTTPPAGAKVVITVFANGEKKWSVTLDGDPEKRELLPPFAIESRAWHAKFAGLPEYDEKGNKITYTIEETTGWGGYEVSYGENNTVINTEKRMNLVVEKQWDDDWYAMNLRPEKVVFTLTADWKPIEGDPNVRPGSGQVKPRPGDVTPPAGPAIEPITITLDGKVDEIETSPWVATLTDMLTHLNGKELTYHLEEAAIPYYRSDIPFEWTVSEVDGVTTWTKVVENTLYIGDDYTVYATKRWMKVDGTEGEAPEGAQVKFVLYANGEKTQYEAVLDGTADTPSGKIPYGYESKPWTATFLQFPRNDAKGNPIEYSVREEPLEGYVTVYEGSAGSQDGIQILNYPEQTSLTVNKVWNDFEDLYGLRPGKITLTVTGLAEIHTPIENAGQQEEYPLPGVTPGESTGPQEEISYKEVYSNTFELTAEEEWTKVIENLPVLDEDGNVIFYKVEEVAVNGYTVKYGNITVTEDNTWTVDIINKIDVVDLVVNKKINVFADQGQKNLTFVMKVTVKNPDGSVKYTGNVAVVFDKTSGLTASSQPVEIPYSEGDTVILEEVYKAGYNLVSISEPTFLKSDTTAKIDHHVEEGEVVDVPTNPTTPPVEESETPVTPAIPSEDWEDFPVVVTRIVFDVENEYHGNTPPQYGSGVINRYEDGEFKESVDTGSQGEDSSSGDTAGN